MLKKFAYFSSASLAAYMLPMLTFAQTTDAEDVLRTVDNLINLVIPILIGVALLIFIIGAIQFIMASDDDAKQKGRDKIIYGLIGLFVIVAVWGLVAILTRTFFGSEDVSSPAPAPTPPPVDF